MSQRLSKAELDRELCSQRPDVVDAATVEKGEQDLPAFVLVGQWVGIESESGCKEEKRNLNDLRLIVEAKSDSFEVFGQLTSKPRRECRVERWGGRRIEEGKGTRLFEVS